ncbi:MAG: MaoC family dehydratase [Lachnospiraceae bacterium]|nr:MaoC family dehydratase [Lachnospiraceae bacterium]
MNTYTFDEISVGQTESFTVRLTDKEMDAFREITGDINPLHKDDAYAAEKGHKSRVAFGMLTASYLSTLAGVYMPGERSLIQSVEIKFSQPVYPGDELTVSGEVTEKNDTFNLIKVKVSVRNQEGKKVLKGSMQIGVME